MNKIYKLNDVVFVVVNENELGVMINNDIYPLRDKKDAILLASIIGKETKEDSIFTSIRLERLVSRYINSIYSDIYRAYDFLQLNYGHLYKDTFKIARARYCALCHCKGYSPVIYYEGNCSHNTEFCDEDVALCIKKGFVKKFKRILKERGFLK